MCALATVGSLVALLGLIVESIIGSTDHWKGLLGGSGFWSALLGWGVIFVVSSSIGARVHTYVLLHSQGGDW